MQCRVLGFLLFFFLHFVGQHSKVLKSQGSLEPGMASPKRKHLRLQYRCRDQWSSRLRSAEAQKKQAVNRGVKVCGNATSVYLRRKCFQQ